MSPPEMNRFTNNPVRTDVRIYFEDNITARSFPEYSVYGPETISTSASDISNGLKCNFPRTEIMKTRAAKGFRRIIG